MISCQLKWIRENMWTTEHSLHFLVALLHRTSNPDDACSLYIRPSFWFPLCQTHSHTLSHTLAFQCLSMCWVELSDFFFYRLVNCNHSLLPYSSISAHITGMIPVWRQMYCFGLDSYFCPFCIFGPFFAQENDCSDGFECLSGEQSCVKAAICVGSVW